MKKKILKCDGGRIDRVNKALAILNEEIEAIGNYGEVVYQDSDNALQDSKCSDSCCCHQEIEKIYTEIQYLLERIREHEKGHLPKIKSLEQLEKALKILGLENEYEIVPERIYASDGKIKKEKIVLNKKN